MGNSCEEEEEEEEEERGGGRRRRIRRRRRPVCVGRIGGRGSLHKKRSKKKKEALRNFETTLFEWMDGRKRGELQQKVNFFF